jgi:hypothetical protein
VRFGKYCVFSCPLATVPFLENHEVDFGSQISGSKEEKIEILNEENILEYSCADDSVECGGEVYVSTPVNVDQCAIDSFYGPGTDFHLCVVI